MFSLAAEYLGSLVRFLPDGYSGGTIHGQD